MQIADIRVTYNGAKITCTMTIPAESHSIGVAPISVKRERREPGDSLYEYGPYDIEALVVEQAKRLRFNLQGAWDDQGRLL